MKKILIVNLIGKDGVQEIEDASEKLSENSIVVDFSLGERRGINDEYAGVIISGSPTNISERADNPWIIEIESLIKIWLGKNIPMLGICFGLQLFADLKKREVIKNEIGRNMGRSIMVFDDNLDKDHYIFKGLDLDKGELEVFCSHLYHVERSENVCGFLKNYQDIPMLEIDRSFIGLQFHPEFSTYNGLEKLKGLVRLRRELLIEDGKDPNQIILDLTEAQKDCSNHPSLKFLTNFVDHCNLN